MDTTGELMRALPADDSGMPLDSKRTAAAIDALSACVQSCTACAAAMAGSGESVCASRCATSADMCGTVLRALLRPAGLELGAVMALLEACIATCMSSAEECRKHAAHSPVCALCADRCETCASACEELMTSLQAVDA